MSTGLATNLSFILLGEDKSASKTMDFAAAKAEQSTARIGGAFQKVGGIIGGEFGAVLGEAGAGIDELGGKGAHLTKVLEYGGGIATVAGGGLLAFSSAGKQATDQLNAAITASGSATSDYTEEIEKAVKKGEDFDHSAVDTKGALTILTEQTQDTGKALDQMGVVTDLAAAKHISLSDAASLVAKILAGSGARTLTQYGIHLDGVGDKTGQSERALEQLSKRLDGQAKSSVSNFGSQVDIVKTKLTDWAEEVAGPVGTAMTILGPITTTAGLAIDFYRGRQEAAAVATLAASAAADTAAASETGLTGATVALDTAMDANPIGLVVGGITALGAVIGGAALLDGMRKATKATTDYSNALSISNGLLDENVEKVALKALLDDGTLKAAQKLGISTSLVVQASIGEGNARQQLSDEIKAQTDALTVQMETNAKAADGQTLVTDAQMATMDSIDKVTGSVLAQTADIKDAISTQNLEKDTLAGLAANADYAAGKYDTLAYAMMQGPLSSRSTQASTDRLTGLAASYGKKAGGGDSHDGGLTLVGEQGPELVNLPAGSHVFSSGTGPSGGGSTVNFNIHLGNSAVIGTADQVGKSIGQSLVYALNNGSVSKTEIKRALGL